MQVNIREDGSEIVRYDRPELQVYAQPGILSDFPDYAAVAHWHDDIELIAVQSGEMQYNVNGDIVTMGPGDGIFVNARQLHFGFSEQHHECHFVCLLLHPALLCASPLIEKEFVLPVISGDAEPYILLRHDVSWQSGAVKKIESIFVHRNEECAPLLTQQLFFALWADIYTHIDRAQPRTAENRRQVDALRKMITFIETNYREKLTLARIAAAGGIGKSSCGSFFLKYTGLTPVAYLNSYRVRRSIELMKTTTMTIEEIAQESGFYSSSYYAETFRRMMGTSPGRYRQG